jgi:hypothetical protein
VAAVSAPTAAAICLAEASGMTLIAVARGEDFGIFTHPARIIVAGGIRSYNVEDYSFNLLIILCKLLK